MSNKVKIWAHTLVKNEERHIWFAVMGVIEYMDKILIWDTGSSDRTVEIIKLIKQKYPKKVEFREVGVVDPETFTKVRQKMLEKTKSDWFIILDGDEVWWRDSIRNLTTFIKREGNDYDSVVSKNFNIVGDIYHYQGPKAGMYVIDKARGHINIRAINRNIDGLRFARPHGQQGLFDARGKLIQERSSKKRKHIKNPAYLHFTNMLRSFSYNEDAKVPKRKIKKKYDLGIAFPLDFYYPEVFFRPRPAVVPSPWVKMGRRYKLRAYFETPIKVFKRKFFLSRKSGY